MAELQDLSATDASNTARFPENQAPSTVNNGARALEGMLARWYADTNGSIVSAGTDTVTLAASRTISAYSQGQVFVFEAGGTNTGAVTLNVDSVGAKAVVKRFNVALAAGDIVAGQIVAVAYEATADNFQLLTPIATAPTDTISAASDTVAGKVELATNAETVTGTDTARAVTPANVTAKMAAPGAIGGTTPAAGNFTTMGLTGDLTMTGASIIEAEGAAVAAATTTNIWATDGGTVHITGTTTITSFGTAPQAGAWMKVIFDGALTLTHGANLSLPGSANITTAADDFAFVYADTTTQFDVIYFKKSGAPVVSSGGFTAVAPVATTSGSTVTLASGIPTGTKFIVILLNGTSLTAGDLSQGIQIGDGGGLETTSYVSTVTTLNAASTTLDATDQFIITPPGVVTAVQGLRGIIILSRESSSTNTWNCTATILSTSLVFVSCGIKSLSAELTQVAIFSAGTFDAGEASVMYSS